MATCSSCGHENPEGQKFCGECAGPLSTSARPLAEERKVITALFCDLIGFTATSESADPEDVDKMLADYFGMARNQIEGHGVVVEKFIGDAVVGVFGVPAAHEDDPERAVRAGMRIAEDAEELEAVGGAPLKLRVGINTGEAFVRLGISAASGEGFLTGDSINTASRLQSVAPEMGVAVGLATYEATSPVFDYEELEPAMLKGKAEPVRVFHAKSPRARLGTDLTRTHDTPFIGREIDLALLKGIFDKTVAAISPQLVTVVSEPGLGKSRIVAELGAYVDLEAAINVYRVDVVSTDSGADDPAGCDGGTGTTAATYFDASFCNGGIRRSIFFNDLLADQVARNAVPQVHVAMVMVNSSISGGTSPYEGIAVFSLPSDGALIGVHELGHAGFGLADEYPTLAGCDSGETGHDHSSDEPMEPNVAANTNRASLKWRDFVLSATPIPTTQNADCTQCDPQNSPVPAGTVGAFEGARYYHCGLYRPEFNCRMRERDQPYCAVCQRRIRETLEPFLPPY